MLVCSALLTALHFRRCWWGDESYAATIDVFNQHYPIALGAVRTLLGDEFPLWCPWRGGGTPWFATTSTNLFDPFTLWLLLFPGDGGMTFVFVSQALATSVSYYVVLRLWRVAHPPALAVALLGVWTSHFLGEMPWRVLTGGHWAIPLAVVAFDRALWAVRPLGYLLGCAVLLACAVFATQPQVWVYVVLFISTYAAVWWWPRRSVAAAKRVVGRGTAVGALVFGLTAVQILPFVEAFGRSNRVSPVPGAQQAREADIAAPNRPAAGADVVRTTLADLQATARAWAWNGQFWYSRGYRALRAFAGVTPALTVLAVVGVPAAWRRPPVRFAAVLIACSAVGLNTYLSRAATQVISGVQLQRLTIFLPWLFGIPAAYGLTLLGLERIPRWGWRRAPVPLAIGLAIAASWAPPLLRTVPTLRRLGLVETLGVSYGLRVGVELLLLVLVLARLGGLPGLTARRFRRLAFPGVLVLATVHAVYSGPPPVRTSPLEARSPLWPDLMRVAGPARLAQLVMQRDPRYYGTDIEEVLVQLPMHPNHAVLYEPPFAAVGNYDNLLVNTYVEYMDMLNLGERSLGWYNMVGVANPGSPLVDLLGVRYVAGRRDVRRAPGGERYALVHYDPAFRYRSHEDVALQLPLFVAENRRALPRAFFLQRAVVVEEQEQRLRLLAARDFDARRAVVLETRPPRPLVLRESMPADADPTFTPATITGYRTNRVDVEVAAPTDGFLVLSDVAFPGWTAEVDGMPAPVLTAYHTFRAVPVPAGSHRVRFVYRPRWFGWGWRISAGAWCGALLMFGILLRRRRASEPSTN